MPFNWLLKDEKIKQKYAERMRKYVESVEDEDIE